LAYNVTNAATLKYNVLKELTQKFKLTNGNVTYDLGYKPASQNVGEQSVQAKGTAEYDIASGNIKSTESVKAGGFALGPIRPWFTVSRSIFFLNHKSSSSTKISNLIKYITDWKIGLKLTIGIA
jgi:hypothetical protein